MTTGCSMTPTRLISGIMAGSCEAKRAKVTLSDSSSQESMKARLSIAIQDLILE